MAFTLCADALRRVRYTCRIGKGATPGVCGPLVDSVCPNTPARLQKS